MSHYICALIGEENEDGEVTYSKENEVVVLTRNIWSKTIRQFYEVLSSEEYDGGYSGVGGRYFNKEELNLALEKLNNISSSLGKQDSEEYKLFIEKCLKALVDDRIFIDFG